MDEQMDEIAVEWMGERSHCEREWKGMSGK